MHRFHGITDIMSEINRMRQLGRTGRAPADEERPQSSPWVPTTDIFARGPDVVIQLELAGVAAEDVDISFAGGVLTISGERKRRPADQGAEHYVTERLYGRFRRSVSLPAGVEDGHIDAYFENGLAEIVVRGGAEPRQSHRIALTERPDRP